MVVVGGVVEVNAVAVVGVVELEGSGVLVVTPVVVVGVVEVVGGQEKWKQYGTQNSQLNGNVEQGNLLGKL